MKQIYQSFKKNTLDVYDVPSPTIRPGMVLIKNVVSVISVGTESMVTSFGEKNLAQKVKSRPDLVKQIIDKVKTDGLIQTINSAKSNLDQPIALGYSCAGVVTGAAEDIYDIKVGDRVACAGAGYAVHAEYIIVPRNLIAVIPDDVIFEEAAFSTIGSIALQGVRLAKVHLGESVAVLGLGLIGLMTVQILKSAGCKIISYDPKNTQVDLAKKMGSDRSTNNSETLHRMSKTISEGYGVDKVIITASTKSDEPVNIAGSIIRDKGTVVAVGAVGLNISRKIYYEKELEFIVSRSYGPGRYDSQYEEKGHDYPIGYVRWTENRNMQAFLQLIHDKKINFEDIITHRFPIEKANHAYHLIKSPENENPIGIVIEYPKETKETKRIELRDEEKLLGKAGENPKIGIIGAGGFASNVLLPILIKLGADMIGICTNGSHKAHHKAKKFGFRYCTTDVNQVLNDDEINTVIISTRHDSHAELVLKALDVKKNVFVEKPLALTLDELDKIQSSIINNQSSILMVGFNRRFSPLTKKMKSLIEKQTSPVSIIMTINVGAIPTDHWSQNPNIGGGRIRGEACHFIDLIRFLVGKPITNWSSNTLGQNKAKDTVSLLFSFEDGSIGSINYFANGSKKFPKERIEVFCNNGILQLDNFKKLTGYGWPGFNKINLYQQNKGHKDEINAFIKAVKNGEPSPIPFKELIEVSRTTIEIANTL